MVAIDKCLTYFTLVKNQMCCLTSVMLLTKKRRLFCVGLGVSGLLMNVQTILVLISPGNQNHGKYIKGTHFRRSGKKTAEHI